MAFPNSCVVVKRAYLQNMSVVCCVCITDKDKTADEKAEQWITTFLKTFCEFKATDFLKETSLLI